MWARVCERVAAATTALALLPRSCCNRRARRRQLGRREYPARGMTIDAAGCQWQHAAPSFRLARVRAGGTAVTTVARCYKRT
eukprot:scaffold2017_cov387-Prasinococcus_capsulatus_cf.AAC.13